MFGEATYITWSMRCVWLWQTRVIHLYLPVTKQTRSFSNAQIKRELQKWKHRKLLSIWKQTSWQPLAKKRINPLLNINKNFFGDGKSEHVSCYCRNVWNKSFLLVCLSSLDMMLPFCKCILWTVSQKCCANLDLSVSPCLQILCSSILIVRGLLVSPMYDRPHSCVML